ncbi:MAG: hypothetical protein OEU92_08255 [Alphaproteobacteria bacterium]|nr:hypothetical protein [Alphaproteobacteria bacterium]
MLIDAATSSRPRRALCGFAVLLVSGCAIGEDGDPGLALAIREHYAAHATEEWGACRSPKIDTIQEHRVLEKSADGEDVIEVRYSYYDRHADMDAAWDKLVFLSQPCGGIAERRFVVARSDVGYRVTEMSGERHGAEGRR